MKKKTSTKRVVAVPHRGIQGAGSRPQTGGGLFQVSGMTFDTLQLNVASWIAVVCFFICGVMVANVLYRI